MYWHCDRFYQLDVVALNTWNASQVYFIDFVSKIKFIPVIYYGIYGIVLF